MSIPYMPEPGSNPTRKMRSIGCGLFFPLRPDQREFALDLSLGAIKLLGNFAVAVAEELENGDGPQLVVESPQQLIRVEIEVRCPQCPCRFIEWQRRTVRAR